MEKEEIKVIDKYFEVELKDPLDFVANDLDENLKDIVDIKAKAEVAKKRKLCESGHINDNVKSNRTICNRNYCKATHKGGIIESVSNITDDPMAGNDDKIKAKMYLNVPNIVVEDTPKEIPVGDMAISPNGAEP